MNWTHPEGESLFSLVIYSSLSKTLTCLKERFWNNTSWTHKSTVLNKANCAPPFGLKRRHGKISKTQLWIRRPSALEKGTYPHPTPLPPKLNTVYSLISNVPLASCLQEGITWPRNLDQPHWMKNEKVKIAQSRPTLCPTLQTVALEAPLSMELSREEYWSGLPFPSPGNLPDPEIDCFKQCLKQQWGTSTYLLKGLKSKTLAHQMLAKM